jgi:hypothetical protein
VKRLTLTFAGEGARFTLYIGTDGNIHTCAEAPLQAGSKRDLRLFVDAQETMARATSIKAAAIRQMPPVEVPFTVEVDEVVGEHRSIGRDTFCSTCPKPGEALAYIAKMPARIAKAAKPRARRKA